MTYKQGFLKAGVGRFQSELEAEEFLELPYPFSGSSLSEVYVTAVSIFRQVGVLAFEKQLKDICQNVIFSFSREPNIL